MGELFIELFTEEIPPQLQIHAREKIKRNFEEIFEKGLKVMDMTAFTLCNENNVPIVVFNMNKSGNLLRVAKGEKFGTIVK